MPSWPNQTKNWSFWSSTSRQSSTNACLQMPKDSTDQHGITTAAKSPRVFVTLDLWMNLQRYGISAPRQVTHKTYYSIENNLSNKYLAIAKWKVQGNYFLYCDVERCGTMFGLTQLCNCPTGRDWVLVCFHHDACGLPFFLFDCWEEVLGFRSTCRVDDVVECRWWLEVLFGFHWWWCILCRFNQVTLEICSESPYWKALVIVDTIDCRYIPIRITYLGACLNPASQWEKNHQYFSRGH